jgi:hypothetical protein
MKLGLQNYVVIMPTENSCIKFNNKLRSLQRHKSTEFYTEWFCICHNIKSKCCNIATLKSSVKENDLNKTCRYIHDLSLYQTSFV